MEDYDSLDQIILQLAGGDPERIHSYRRDYTHSEIAEAWQSYLMSKE